MSGFCVVPTEFLPDANASAPDADPNAPDANLNTPDADPNAPDADPGGCEPLSPVIALVDDFEDGAATPLWDDIFGMGLTFAESGGVLSITADSAPPGTRQSGYSSLAEDLALTNSSFYVELPTMVNLASNASALVRLGPDTLNKLEFIQAAGTLNISLTINSSTSSLASFAYSATDDRWWRVVDSGGSFEVQTSADATTWVTRGGASTPAFFSGVKVDIFLVAKSGGSAPGTLTFDNANRGLVPCVL